MNETVSKNALIRRIRGALRHENLFLVVARGGWYRNEQCLGSYYLVDANRNVQAHHCELVTLARELGVLGEWETVKDGDTPREDAGGVGASETTAQSAPEEATPPTQINPIHECGEWEGLMDEEGRLWVSWPKQKKADNKQEVTETEVHE